MKTLISLTIFLLLSNLSFGQFWKSKPKPTSTRSPVAVAVTNNTPNTIQQARTLIKELNNELQSAQKTNTELKTKLDAANLKVKDAELNTQKVQKNADALKAWGIDQQNQAFQWMEKHTNTLKKYHRLKNITALVAGLFGAMLGMYCMRFVPPVYAAYAFGLPIVGAILAFGGVWIFF